MIFLHFMQSFFILLYFILFYFFSSPEYHSFHLSGFRYLFFSYFRYNLCIWSYKQWEDTHHACKKTFFLVSFRLLHILRYEHVISISCSMYNYTQKLFNSISIFVSIGITSRSNPGQLDVSGKISTKKLQFEFLHIHWYCWLSG